jgi:hypothetical protein
LLDAKRREWGIDKEARKQGSKEVVEDEGGDVMVGDGGDDGGEDTT